MASQGLGQSGAQDREFQLRVGVFTGSSNLLSALGIPYPGRPGPQPVRLDVGGALSGCDYAVAGRAAVARGRCGGRYAALPQLRRSRYLVVGIARDLAFGSMTSPASGVVVSAGPVLSGFGASFVIRTDHPSVVSGLVSRTLRGHAVHVATGIEVVAQDIGHQRLGVYLFSGFGLAALLLGVGGAFGLVAYLTGRSGASSVCAWRWERTLETLCATDSSPL